MKRWALVLIALFFGIVAGIYASQLIGPTHPLLTNVLFLIAPFLSVIAGIYALNIYHFSSSRGKVIAFITAGLACWFIGELIFFLYLFVFHIDPFPSLADIFYIAAYPLILVGLIKEILSHNHLWGELNKLMAVLGASLITALGFIVVYFGIILAYKPEEPLLHNAIALGYGIGDLVLLLPVFFILKVALDFRGGKLFNSWILVLLAMLCIMAGDILFAIFNDQYEAVEPRAALIDLTWTAGYLLFAYGFIYTASTIKELQLTLKK